MNFVSDKDGQNISGVDDCQWMHGKTRGMIEDAQSWLIIANI